MNRKRIIWTVIGLAVVAGVFIVGSRIRSGGSNDTANAEAGSAETVDAFVGDLSASVTASGQVAPQRDASISVESPGIVTAVNVRIGDSVQASDILVQLDTANLEIGVANAEQTVAIAEARLENLLTPASATDIAAAEANVASAQATLDDFLDGPSETDIALSETSVRSSEASVWSASADLASQRASITESQIKAAEAALLSAQIRLDAARETNEDDPTQATHDALLDAERAFSNARDQLDTLLDGPDVLAAQNSVAAASARLDGSQISLDTTLAGATAVNIASAQSNLAQAQANLANLVDGPTAESILASEAEVEQARIALANAQDQLAGTSIVAPFDGLVTAVNVNPGEFAAGVVVELIDRNSLEVVLSVDEVDIGIFAIGQAATINMETWPNQFFDSTIVRIAPSANNNNSALVSYNVNLALTETDLPILVGMTANANLITAQRENVLLVPNRAIRPERVTGMYFVNLQQADGTTQEVEVTIGLRDDDNTQITDGIVAGDTLIIGDTSVNDFGGGPPFGGDN
ncbi:MAG: efflux RND transporter periplasmic adaptor subunit [Chloroflexi bacterium]|nr:efflux RND transporter periplasmic adaptor subunit [Chloroflexota bacterium]